MKSIIKISSIITMLICLSFSTKLNAHIEIVANLTIEPTENGLMVTAILEKTHLTYALKKEAQCLPKDMLNVCANAYVEEHIKIKINGAAVTLTKTNQRLTKNSLIISYKVDFAENISSLSVKSDYMLNYNDHSKVKVISKLATKNKLYSLSASRQFIEIKL